jgi:WD40 repeat protein
MFRLINENILKLIFNSFSLFVNRQLFNKIKSKVINSKIILQILHYKKMFKSLGRSHVIIDSQVDEYPRYEFLTELPNSNLAVGQDGLLKIFNLQTYSYIKTFNFNSYLNSLYVLPGKRFVACLDDKIEIWGEFIEEEINLIKTIEFNIESYKQPLLLSNGQLLCFAMAENMPCMLIFNIDKPYDYRQIWAHGRNHAINLPNNKFVVECSHGFRIYDIDNDYQCSDFTAGDEDEIFINCLIYNEKDNLLLTGCEGVIKVWDVTNSFECVMTIDAHEGSVISLVLLPNGYFASTSCDTTIKIWDMNGYVCVNKIELDDDVGEDFLFYLKDGRLVSIFDAEIIIWNY